ncbi:sialidase family protein [Thiohalobacter sp. IOR34]|uniref:sialidase family protein n=1 Tax=Thiohalobacter sp. IOR34 TaxID=3057176 RepID=UPI0025B11C23|nr:sialidase family protein [Thiohalobacter sp. IOR34]WJW75353.1 sialidase family protein [Thiohalobacter sp. IOR34]
MAGAAFARPGYDPCADVAQPASLACARTVTPFVDRQGRIWLAWAQHGHVYVQQAADPATGFGPPRVVNPVPEPVAAHGENRPKLVVDGEGRIFVSWTRRGRRRFSGDIRFSRSLDGGRTFSEPLTVNDDRRPIGHRFDVLAVNDRGQLFIAWLDKRDRADAEAAGRGYRGAAVYYSWSNDAGSSFQPDRRLAGHSCECCRVAMALDRDGLPVVMWRHIFDDNVRDHALLKLEAPDRPGTPRRVSFDEWRIDACPHHGPALSVDADAVYHLAWFDNGPRHHGLFYAHSADQGRSLSRPLPFGDERRAAGHPALLAIGREIYLAWREFDGSRSRILGMRSGNGGETWEAARVLAEAPGEADYPFLVARDGQAWLSWQTRETGYRLLEFR